MMGFVFLLIVSIAPASAVQYGATMKVNQYNGGIDQLNRLSNNNYDGNIEDPLHTLLNNLYDGNIDDQLLINQNSFNGQIEKHQKTISTEDIDNIYDQINSKYDFSYQNSIKPTIIIVVIGAIIITIITGGAAGPEAGEAVTGVVAEGTGGTGVAGSSGAD